MRNRTTILILGHSRIRALKNELLVASMCVLVGLWFARALPAEPLTADAQP